MSGYCQGIGLFGAGSTGGVVAELLCVGAMDAFLIKGAEYTFWRFRYCRHTNFAMDAVGQPFNTQPQFGGHSQITLNRAGDLVYYMYVCIDLPGIYATRRSAKGFSQGGGDYDYDYTGMAPQFPVYNRGAPGCKPCEAQECDAYRTYARDYEGADPRDPNASEVGHASWARNNYGGVPPSAGAGAGGAGTASVPQSEKPWCHWANAIGQLLIRRAVLVVGGHQSDMLYSDYLYMWEELSGKAGKRLREMIGKRKSRRQLIKDARHDQRFYVPLPWYFTLTSGNALPLCTLQFHGVQVHIEWERLNRCVVVSHDDVEVRKCCDGTKLTSNDLKAWIDTTYIYLDIDERNRFSLANFDQLITQVQFIPHTATAANTTVPLTFNHPCIELIWAVRRRCNELANQHFNYSGIDGRDPIEEVSLRLNNLLRFSGREGRYYRTCQPYQHHSAIPKAHIYCYCFGLFPEDAQPSGSLNLSRIDNADMTFNLQEGLGKEQCTILIFARNWNIMRYTEGLAGPLFNN
jgi:hypothetical protein